MEDEKKKTEICPETGKICYSEREASEIINRLHRGMTYINKDGRKAKIKYSAKNIPKRKYFCTYCGTYHLTHLPYYKHYKEKKEYE
ncbi:MAG: hypothetical protein WC900_05610 [Oscillospiraceae bacterium]|jgi:hypothetical protein